MAIKIYSILGRAPDKGCLGIEDGFLSPYRVHRVLTTFDATGWRPNKGQLDKYGRAIPDDEYQTKDFERVVSLQARTDAIARHLTDFLKKSLGEYFKRIVIAADGVEALQLIKSHTPDIIVSDVMMPRMNGYELCKNIKEDITISHIPIILLTALVGDEDVVKGIELGADDYILKPFNPEILRTKVKRLIKSRVELKQIYTKLLMPSINAIGDIQEENDIAIKIEDPFVTQILKIINDNLQNQEFNVKKLAEMLNMSQPTLYRRVKQLTNFTIIELVRGVRLKRSAELLRTKKYSVQEVAEMVGYNDIPTFRKHFVDFYGTTPSTFNSKEETEDKK